MGIYGFSSWIQNNSPFKNTRGNKIPENVSCLFLDMNGIFHGAAQRVYCYGENDDPDLIKNPALKEIQMKRREGNKSKTAEELQKEHCQEIIRRIIEIIDKINPRDYVVLAVDGVAPMAKITQQRKRRYVAAKESSEKSKSGAESSEGAEDSKDVPLIDTKKFDSNSITPGTEFMFYLDAFIKQFIANAIKNNRFPVREIIYSSHLIPGEGEHKIFDLVRNKKIQISEDGANMVYGKDADLFMLTLLSDIPYLYLCQEDYKVIYNIDLMRNIIYKQMPDNIPDKIKIQDYILFIYLIGNDFLPRFPFVDGVKDTMAKMQDIYNYMEKPLTSLGYPEFGIQPGQIIWNNLALFFKNLIKFERKSLGNIANTAYAYPFTILDESKTKNSKTGVYEVDFEKFRTKWYERALSPRTPEASLLGVGVNLDEEIDSMCLEYFRGIQWTLQYYMFGQDHVTTRYVYPYHYAPLVEDLFRVLMESDTDNFPLVTDVVFTPDDPVITPIHQLICVMPPKSWNLIPLPYRELMKTRFNDISPDSFITETEAIDKLDAMGNPPSRSQNYQKIAILSIVDPVRIVTETSDYPIPDKYKKGLTRYVKNVFNPIGREVLKGVKLNDLSFLKNKKAEDFLTTKPGFVEIKETDEAPIVYEPPVAKTTIKSPRQIKRIVKEKVKAVKEYKKEKEESKPVEPGKLNFNWNDNLLM